MVIYTFTNFHMLRIYKIIFVW